MKTVVVSESKTDAHHGLAAAKIRVLVVTLPSLQCRVKLSRDPLRSRIDMSDSIDADDLDQLAIISETKKKVVVKYLQCGIWLRLYFNP